MKEKHELIFREFREGYYINVKNRFDVNWEELFSLNEVSKFAKLPVKTLIVHIDDSYDSNLEDFTFDF